MHQLINKLNLVDLTVAYGMSESTAILFQNIIADTLTRVFSRDKVSDKHAMVLP